MKKSTVSLIIGISTSAAFVAVIALGNNLSRLPLLSILIACFLASIVGLTLGILSRRNPLGKVAIVLNFVLMLLSTLVVAG